MAAVGVRTLALLFGAGYSGTYAYNNMDKARSLAEAFLKQTSTDKSSSQSAPKAADASANSTSTELDALSKQMAHLAQEVSRSRSDPVLLMQTSYKGALATVTDIFNLLGWAVTAVSIGGIVYYIAYRKRFRLKDLAWVGQTRFTETVSAMQTGISRVSGALGAVKRDITQRFTQMEARVDKVQDSLSGQIEAEIGQVKTGVAEVGKDVSDVSDRLDHVGSRISELDMKMDYVTNGIYALVNAVSTFAPERLKPGMPFYELKKFANLSNGAPVEGSLIRQRLSQDGLLCLTSKNGNEDESNANVKSTPQPEKGMTMPWQ